MKHLTIFPHDWIINRYSNSKTCRLMQMSYRAKYQFKNRIYRAEYQFKNRIK